LVCQEALYRFADAHLNQKQNHQRFAPANALQEKEERLKKITNQEYANYAKKNLNATNTQLKNFAQDYVETLLELKTEQKVYNISVCDVNEYFANGILVHNCADSALYNWREALNYTAQPEKPKPLPNSEEAIEQFWQQEQDSIASSKSKAFWEV
jgi:hypothetical protein